MLQRPEPDDFCPSCGIPVPLARRGPQCPYCGHEFAAGAIELELAGYLTTFGYGVCGFVAGTHLGLARALVEQDITFGDPRLVLFPAVGAIACALLAAAVGSRLDIGLRRGYEALLFGSVLAAFLTMCLALLGVSSVEALAIVAVCAAGLMARVLRRRLYNRSPHEH